MLGNVISIKDSTTKSEILWCLFIVKNHWSAHSSSKVAPLFKCMFPGNISENFTFSRHKFAYLLNEAVAPFLREEMLLDVNNKYVILYDETTNKKSEKELQLQIRFWSKERQIVMCI